LLWAERNRKKGLSITMENVKEEKGSGIVITRASDAAAQNEWQKNKRKVIQGEGCVGGSISPFKGKRKGAKL